LILVGVVQEVIASSLWRSVLILSLLIMWSRNSSSSLLNSHLEIFATNMLSIRCCMTVSTYLTYSSNFFELIIILSKYTWNFLLITSPKTVTSGALVSAKGVTMYSKCSYLIRKEILNLSPFYIHLRLLVLLSQTYYNFSSLSWPRINGD